MQDVAVVIGIDPSADQLAYATPHPKICYLQAAAEQLPVAAQRINLITAAQAAHWFDLPAFYNEVQRIGAPDGIVALISYGTPKLSASASERFGQFCQKEIAPYWPPERQWVESGYQTLDFPFAELPAPPNGNPLALDPRRIYGLSPDMVSATPCLRRRQGRVISGLC